MSKLTSARTMYTATLALAAVAIAAAIAIGPAVRTVTIHASFVKSSVGDLVKRADAVAIVEVSGPPTEHWNSSNGGSWGTLGVDSFIYRDVPVSVVKLIAGASPASMTLRDLGGTADGFRFVYDGSADWTTGAQYLVFLQKATFPTKEGTETSWTPVRLGQGVFSWSGKDWFESIQDLHLADQQLQDVVAPISAN